MNVSTVSSSSATNQVFNPKSKLNTDDFIKMMLTQLQNQDPMEPAKNQELLAQMSQIGQLQSSNDLQASLKTMVLQSQVGSASGLIGKVVAGLDAQNDPVTGLVTSIRVQDNTVELELDNGQTLSLDRVTQIAPATSAAPAA